MSRTVKVLTPDQVKKRLQIQGITIAAWAEDRGYTRGEVYRVLNGQHKGNYGKSHSIAVELGLKPATVQSNDTADFRNPQKKAAA